MARIDANAPDQPEPKYRGARTMPFIIGNETFEKLGSVGTSYNLMLYLTSIFHMSSISSLNVVNIFNGSCNFGALAGALLSDSYLGRYNTIALGSISAFLGMVFLTCTAALPSLHPVECSGGICSQATRGQIGFLYAGFGLMVIGASGIRPCNLAFGADQFDPKTDSGKKGIASFFNWYYLTFTFATMVSLTGIVYVQSEKSWPIGLAIPAILMLVSCGLFFLGTRLYVLVLPEGSPLVGVAQVVVAAVKKWKLKLPENPEASLFRHFPAGSINSRLPYTDKYRFLSKAAIITAEDNINADGSATNPWRLSTVQNVEEVKCIVKVIPIWISTLVYLLSPVLNINFSILQATLSDRRLGSGGFQVPPTSFILFAMLTVTLWVPIFDRLVVPVLRKRTGKAGGMTILQRMGIGIAIVIAAMVAGGVMEGKRRHVALTKPTLGYVPGKGAISSMSAFWLVPQMIIMGFSEAFFIIGGNQFFYQQSPENMRSILVAFTYVALGLSQYLSTFIISVVRKITRNMGGLPGGWFPEDLNTGRLDYYYYLFAALELANLIFFLMTSASYEYKEAAEDDDDGGMEEELQQRGNSAAN